MKLKYKIWLLLALLLCVVLAIDLTFSYRKLEEETRAELEYDAKTIYGFMMATRRIYQEQFVASGLPVNEHTIGFLPAHSFSRIARDFANWNDSGIYFNNVTDRPRNPVNQADRFELEAMDWFRANPKSTELMRDIVTDKGVGYLLFTAPIRIEPFCLKCHGDRAAAPASIREAYDSAYGYRVGDLRGVVSIRLPTEKFKARVMRLWTGQLFKSLVDYALIFVALGVILDRLVLRRLARLQDGARRIAAGEYGARIRISRHAGLNKHDEIQSLAATFNRMADEVQQRERAVSKLSQAVEQSPTGIMITDLQPCIEYVNSALLRSTGYTREELLGANPTILKSDDVVAGAYKELWTSLAAGRVWEGEFITRRKDGSSFHESAIVAPMRDHEGRISHYLAIKQDITDRKRAEAEIHHLAFYDPLTGLPNRRLLMDRIGHALAACQRNNKYGALLILDLDHFKTLNDTRGHDVGDLWLKEVAQRLVGCLRQEDTVARLGGDEYVAILESLGEVEAGAAALAERIAEKIRDAISQPFALDGQEDEYETTASLGIVVFCAGAHSGEQLIKQADVALYQAKDAGRNAIRFFNPDMQAAIEARSELEHALRQALPRNELRLYYQPQLDEHGRVIGAEALIRWQRAGVGLVPPDRFIPLAEETGLIIGIGDWVVHTACTQLQAWSTREATRHLRIAINISARQFLQSEFVERIAGCLKQTGIDPSLVKLELTESVVLDNVDEVIRRMNEIKALGVRFSLDDFGTGYSSLSYLKRLPLDQLKIDKSFVHDVIDDPNDAAIVRAILAMSGSLGLDVIAEGVETEAQYRYLLDSGCRGFQGYLFGKPMPIEVWEDWFAKMKPD